MNTLTIMPCLKDQLDAGAFVSIDSDHTRIASVTRTGDGYRFQGVTGSHILAIDATDAERLAAHWQGFSEACITENDRRNRENAKRIEIEQTICKQVVADALAAGYAIDVDDGGEVVLRGSRDKAAIVAAMFSTDGDFLTIRQADDGRRVGSISLVYGNGPHVISDHTDKPEIDAVIARANATADKLGA